MDSLARCSSRKATAARLQSRRNRSARRGPGRATRAF